MVSRSTLNFDLTIKPHLRPPLHLLSFQIYEWINGTNNLRSGIQAHIPTDPWSSVRTRYPNGLSMYSAEHASLTLSAHLYMVTAKPRRTIS